MGLETSLDNNTPNIDKRNIQRVFGRRLSRPLNGIRKQAIEEVLPKLAVPEAKMTEARDITSEALFGDAPEVLWLEVGFGSGEHVIGVMAQEPETAFIAVEPFINGMATFLKDLPAADHARTRVHMDDAMMLVRSMADNMLDGVYVLNPDPWPKKRHHKRRIISQDNLKEFHRVMKDGAQLVMATDVDDLAEWMVTQTMMSGLFEWSAESASDWQTKPENWVTTRYEEKGANHSSKRQSYLLFRKI